jgi:putative ABC transport system substrate-binding protein
LTLARNSTPPVRIGWVSAGQKEGRRPLIEAFRQGMSELGYVEGEGYVIDFHWAGDTPKTLDDMESALMHSHPDLVVATCQFTSRSALKATPNVPVVVAGGVDLVSAGLAVSLAQPGGSITGLTSLSPEIAGKRLELLKETVPYAARIAVLNQIDTTVGTRSQAELQRAAEVLGVELINYDLGGTSDYERVFEDIRARKADAVLMVAGPTLFFSNRRAVADLALQSRLPSSFPTYEFVQEGGMMSLGVDLPALFRRSALYVDKILKGARPGALPIEQPTSFELTLNLRTARALGIDIPQSVLVRADRIIE